MKSIIILTIILIRTSAFILKYHNGEHRHTLSTLLNLSDLDDDDALELFSDALTKSLKSNEFVSLKLNVNDKLSQLGNTLNTNIFKINVKDLKSVTGRLINIKSSTKCQLSYKYATNDQVKNYNIPDESQQVILDIIQSGIIKKTTLNMIKECIEFTYATNGNHKLKRTKIGNTKTKIKSDEITPPTAVVVAAVPDESHTVDTVTTSNSATTLDDTSTITLHINKDDITTVSTHDKIKSKYIPLDSPFLKHLNLILSDGTVRAKSSDKLKQIQNFVSIMDVLINKVYTQQQPQPEQQSQHQEQQQLQQRLKIVDMGCGMGYLTFSMQSYFSTLYNTYTYGIEIRPTLVQQTNDIVTKLDVSRFKNLRFLEGSISNYDLNTVFKTDLHINPKSDTNNSKDIQVLVALHACDTATDDAIYKGLLADCDIIVVSPCCQKQIRRQIDAKFKYDRQTMKTKKKLRNLLSSTTTTKEGDSVTSNINDTSDNSSSNVSGNMDQSLTIESLAIQTLLESGKYRDFINEMVTDKLRALLLELMGYETNIIEFTDVEYTAKNIMITALKRRQDIRLLQDENRKTKLLKQIMSLIYTFGVTRHHLIELLQVSHPDIFHTKTITFSYSKSTV